MNTLVSPQGPADGTRASLELNAAALMASARSVLAVCAHPDDESFGLGAVISTLVDHGTSVDLAVLTRGEASTLGASSVDLAQQRRRELIAAADELGVRAVHFFDHPDGHLSTVDTERLATDLRPLAADRDLLLVFDEAGITGHPDHIRATAAAMAVAEHLDLPVLAWTLDQQVADALNDEFHAGFIGRAGDEIDLRLAVDRRRQRAAIERHRSQLDGNPVPARRITLTGDHEPLHILRQARPVLRQEPLGRAMMTARTG